MENFFCMRQKKQLRFYRTVSFGHLANMWFKNPVTLHISHDENIKEEKENKTMVKVTVNVEGMMCGHCEAHVNKAIQAAFGAEDVVSSHENGTTVFSVPEKVDEAKVEEVIKEAGYEFKGITQE